MAQRKTLSDRQVSVLRWVESGCPEVSAEDSYRISVGALRNRGLVVTSGKARTWTASITEQGREYLKSVDGPRPPIPRQSNVSVTQQLVDDVIAAGGSLRVPRRGWGRRGIDYEQRARLAHVHDKVPDGKWLSVSIASSDELPIDLVAAPRGAAQGPRPVPVPGSVSKYHAVVRHLKDRKERHEVSRAALPRALRIVEGLIAEAERRGYQATVASDVRDLRRREMWSGPTDGHFVITVAQHAERIRIREEGLPTRSYWSLEAQRSPSALKEYEAGATGRLTLELLSGAGRSVRPSSWSDRKAWTLDDKLPDVLYEIEIRAVEHEQRVRQAEREAEERQVAWEAAKVLARERYAENERVKACVEQVTNWEAAEKVRRYCAAANAAHASSAETREWLAWAREYADRIDPLRFPPRAPDREDNLSAEQLRPYLDGWDPYQPTRHR